MKYIFKVILVISLLLLFYNNSFCIISPNIDTIRIEAERSFKSGDAMSALELYKAYEENLTDYFYDNYDEEIKSLYQIYEIDEKEFNNKQEENNLIYTLLGYIFVFIFINLVTYYVLKKKNKELIETQKELYSAKQLAEYSIKNKSVLISNMSHEIRTPLNAITGFSELLILKDIDETYREQCIDIISQNSILLTKLINDVLNVSNSESNEMKFTISKCEIISLCRKIVKTMNKIKDSDAEIIFETDLDSFIIETDAERLQQIIINLLNNAIKFCKAGIIELSITRNDSNELKFAISDTGCGISPKQQNKIFGRFEKLNENIAGTGIGLSICKVIIERLKGKIYLDTQYDKGARFVFTHPINH